MLYRFTTSVRSRTAWIIEAVRGARRAVVLGASFIGLEVAASLRARALDVHVVAPGQGPLERTLGPQLGDLVPALHESHGVVFHLGQTPRGIERRQVLLQNGGRSLRGERSRS